MRLLEFFRKTKKIEKKSSKFSDFFLYASEDKKQEVFKEAARRANEDQRKVFEISRLKIKTG